MNLKDITYNDKIGELILDVQHPNSINTTFIFVEGIDDIKIFKKFFDLNTCKIESIPGGKIKLEQALVFINNYHKKLLGIRDADFDNLKENLMPLDYLFLSDLHDIEMTIISEDTTFNAILHEYTHHPIYEHAGVRDKIIATLESISLLKMLNDFENLEFKFDIGFIDLIDFESEKIDFDQFLNRIFASSPNCKIKDKAVLLKKIAELKLTNPPEYQICNGHDFSKAIAEYIKRTGNNNGVSYKTIQSHLRTVYSFPVFKNSILHNKIFSWGQANNIQLFQNIA